MDIGETPHPQEVPRKSPLGSVPELSQFIKTERKPLDYTKIVKPTTRVLAIGENHPQTSHKQEVIDHMQQFRDLGFTHLAFEGFGVDTQTLIDEFQATGQGRDKLEAYLKGYLGPIYPGVGDKYIDIIAEAGKKGIKVVAIDLSKEEREKHKGNNAEDSKDRDKTMAARAQKPLEDSEHNKVITLTGAIHASKTDAAMAGIINHGFETVSLRLADERSGMTIEPAIQQTNTGHERFMLPSLSEFPDSSYPYDWIANIPVGEETNYSKLMNLVTGGIGGSRHRGEPPMSHGDRGIGRSADQTYADLDPQIEKYSEGKYGFAMQKNGNRYVYDETKGFTVIAPQNVGTHAKVDSRPMTTEEIQMFLSGIEAGMENAGEDENYKRLLQAAKTNFDKVKEQK